MASGHQRVPHQQAGHMAAPTSSASPSKNPLPTGSRPHMARNGNSDHIRAMSAYHPTPDVAAVGRESPKLTRLGHNRVLATRMAAARVGKKLTRCIGNDLTKIDSRSKILVPIPVSVVLRNFPVNYAAWGVPITLKSWDHFCQGAANTRPKAGRTRL